MDILFTRFEVWIFISRCVLFRKFLRWDINIENGIPVIIWGTGQKQCIMSLVKQPSTETTRTYCPKSKHLVKQFTISKSADLANMTTPKISDTNTKFYIHFSKLHSNSMDKTVQEFNFEIWLPFFYVRLFRTAVILTRNLSGVLLGMWHWSGEFYSSSLSVACKWTGTKLLNEKLRGEC